MRKNFKAELKKLREENEQLKKENVYLKNRLEAQSIATIFPCPVPVQPSPQYPPSPYANPFWYRGW